MRLVALCWGVAGRLVAESLATAEGAGVELARLAGDPPVRLGAAVQPAVNTSNPAHPTAIILTNAKTARPSG